MNKILVTGVSGFIGTAVVNKLVEHGYYVRGTVRQEKKYNLSASETVAIGDICQVTDWNQILDSIDVVIHLVSRAHILHESTDDPIEEFRRINVDATIRFAQQCAEKGVKRFVYLSSIGVLGNGTTDSPFTESSHAHPGNPYTVSKYEAEQQLLLLAKETDMEVVIIRPPLVYGPNAPGNFGKLVRWVKKGIPLPLGAIHNRRSFIALENMTSFIATCIDHPKAGNELFLVSDGEDVSTTEFLRRIATAMGKPSRLLPVPEKVLELGLKILGKGNMAQQLCGSLQVDSSKARELLGWRPVISMNEQLKQIAGVS